MTEEQLREAIKAGVKQAYGNNDFDGSWETALLAEIMDAVAIQQLKVGHP